MKKSYEKSIKLQCLTCGADSFFEADEETGVITCSKCNRVYHGGYDELVNLNQKRIDDEIVLCQEEVKKDLEKDVLNIFKKSGFTVK